MDILDKALLNKVQTDFPVAARPYLVLANLVGTSEEEAWQRIVNLRKNGIIRRLGGVFDSHRLGYKSTLCCAKVPEGKIPVLSELLQNKPGVTHNYIRDHEYNMWFTLIASSQEEVDKTLDLIRFVLESHEVYSLPALRLFKISVDFDFNDSEDDNALSQDNHLAGFVGEVRGNSKPSNTVVYEVTESEKELIRQLQGNLPEDMYPYAKIADQLGWTESEVISQTKNLIDSKVIRRFGAVLRHQKAGFVANVMGVWQVPEERAEDVGKIMAGFREVSHCYQRPPLADWPYNLFTMIHGRSAEDCLQVMKSISEATGIET
ncbi:MAG: AsnC family transcriptional regulator, partial [Desulfitobacterium hafniense]|nr:AsnC family transcriptional regulator [Desulfitobacterium hafniense]